MAVSGGHLFGAGLVIERAGEDREDRMLARFELVGLGLGLRLDIGRNEIGERGKVDEAILPTAPVLIRFPGAGHDVLTDLGVEAPQCQIGQVRMALGAEEV